MRLVPRLHVAQGRDILFERHDASPGKLLEHGVGFHVIAVRVAAQDDPGVGEFEAHLFDIRPQRGNGRFEIAVDEDIAFGGGDEKRGNLTGPDGVDVPDHLVRRKRPVPIAGGGFLLLLILGAQREACEGRKDECAEDWRIHANQHTLISRPKLPWSKEKLLEHRSIGSLSVSLVGMGCNNFGWRIDAAGTKAVVDSAIESGINFFDTADFYGAGQSEEFLGQALGSRRGSVLIATKFGLPMSDVMHEHKQGGFLFRHLQSSVHAHLPEKR